MVYTATYTDPKDEKLALDLGADAFIVKPAEPDEFMAQIVGILANQLKNLQREPHLPQAEEKVLLKEYNEVLIHKLEQKALHLEKANATLLEEIQERKLIEEKLKEKEELLSLFFAQSLDGFFFMMLDESVEWNDSVDKEKTLDYVFEHHRITKANQALLDQYRATEEQFIGLTPNDFFAHDISQGRKVWRDLFDKGHLHIDTHEKKFDGTEMIIEGDYICLYDSRNRIKGHFGVQKEVTDIRLAEEILHKTKSELEEYFENDISADYLASVEGELFSCNKTFLDLFGFENKSHAEKFDIKQLYKNPNDRKQIIGLIIQNKKVENYEVDFITYDGKLINAIINAIGIFNSSGELVRIRGYIVDITDRRLTEKKLLESETRFRSAFENAPVGMSLIGVDGSFVQVNDVLCKMLAYSQEELLAKKIFDITYPDDIELTNYMVSQSVFDKKKNLYFEKRYIRKDGTILWAEISSTLIRDEKKKPKYFIVQTLNITERKHSELEYQTIIKTSVDGFLVNDSKTRKFLDVNDSYCNMIGYSREELLKMSIQDVEENETIEETKIHLENIIKKGFDSFETKHRTKSGKIIYVEVSVKPDQVSGTKFYSFIKNISERKAAEEKLLKLSHAVEQSPVSIIITDKKGKMEYANSKVEEITGYNIDEMIGKNPSIFKSGETTLADYRNLWSTITSGLAWFGEFHNKKKNGELFWEYSSISPIKNEKGEITHYIAVKEDITKRKQAEEIINNITQRMSLATKAVGIGVWDWDLKNNELIWDDRMFELYGVKPEEFGGVYEAWEKCLHPDDLINQRNEIQAAIAGERDFHSVFRIVHPGSQVRFIEARALVISTPDGIPERIVGLNWDVTENKLAEKELILAKERAEESDQLKTAFLNSISHELRTPLNAINGFSGLINKELHLDDIISFCKIINTSGNHLLGIIEDIFDLTILEANQMRIEKESHALIPILEELTNIMQPERELLKKTNIDIVLKVDPKIKDYIIYTDKVRFNQIMINLLKNALKFTKKGFVEFGFTKVNIKNENYLRFYVRDTGIGIPKNMQMVIFDIFRQVENSNSRLYGGTGIGLSVCKKLAILLGGDIWVESEVGIGSTFYFTIPYQGDNQKTESDQRTFQMNKLKFPGKTILIAEDDEISFDFLKILSSMAGIKAIRAHNGKEAVELCYSNPEIDLVFMDVRMPLMDGFKAAEIIKKTRPNLVIIAQTAYAQMGELEKSIQSGCDDYILKPIKKEIFFELVKKYLGPKE